MYHANSNNVIHTNQEEHINFIMPPKTNQEFNKRSDADMCKDENNKNNKRQRNEESTIIKGSEVGCVGPGHYRQLGALISSQTRYALMDNICTYRSPLLDIHLPIYSPFIADCVTRPCFRVAYCRI